MALSVGARTNNWLQSASLATTPNSLLPNTRLTLNAGIAPDGTNTACKISETVAIDTFRLYQPITMVSGQSYGLRVWLKSAERNFATVKLESSTWSVVDLVSGSILGSSGLTSATATKRSDGWVEVVVVGNASSSGAINSSFGPLSTGNYGVYLGTVGSGILAWHPMFVSGSAVGSDIPTTTAPVTVTDYTVSGLTYTFAETPLTGSILSYDGYSYTAAYADFTFPVCGSISISPSGLTSGKLRLTASVDGSNFNSTVILPIDETTGALAASSDLPNGLYTLNVKPFKSVRFTQTDVTDTVTIPTALGM